MYLFGGELFGLIALRDWLRMQVANSQETDGFVPPTRRLLINFITISCRLFQILQESTGWWPKTIKLHQNFINLIAFRSLWSLQRKASVRIQPFDKVRSTGQTVSPANHDERPPLCIRWSPRFWIPESGCHSTANDESKQRIVCKVYRVNTCLPQASPLNLLAKYLRCSAAE